MYLGISMALLLFIVGYIILGISSMTSVLHHTISCNKLTLGDIIRLVIFLPLAICAFLGLSFCKLLDKFDEYMEKLDKRRIL